MAKTLAELDKEFQLNKTFGADARLVPVLAEADLSPHVETSPPVESAAAAIVPESAHNEIPAKTAPKSRGLAALDAQFRGRSAVETAAEPAEDTPPQQVRRSRGLAALDAQFRVQPEVDADAARSESIVVPEIVEDEQAAPVVRKRRFARVFSLASDVIFYVAMLILVLSAFTVMQNGKLPFSSNYRFYSVLTSSMESVYPKGSLIIVAKTDPDRLIIGNDITFHTGATDTITHRIVDVIENYNGSGQRAFQTKGVNNQSADESRVPANDVVGKVIFFVPGLGAFFYRLAENLYLIVIFFVAGVGFSFFLNMTLGETFRERRIRKAKAVLQDSKS